MHITGVEVQNGPFKFKVVGVFSFKVLLFWGRGPLGSGSSGPSGLAGAVSR